MKAVQKVINTIAKYVGYISFVGVVIGVLFVVVDVILRYIFKNPIPGDYDYTELWLSVIVMSALAYVQTEHGHVNVTMLIKLFKPQAAIATMGFATVVGAAIAGVCAYSCYGVAMRSFGRHMETMMAHVPYGPFQIFECVCMGLLALTMLVDAVIYFTTIPDATKCKEIVDSWA